MVSASTTPPLAFLNMGPGEMLVLAVVALLLFGSDLPDKAREWGRMFAEFKQGLNRMQSEFHTAMNAEPEKPQRLQHYPEFRDVEPVAPTETGVEDAAEAKRTD